MNNHVIITKKASQDIPRGFMQLALQKFPTCYGLVLQDKDGDKPILDIAREGKTPSLDDMMKMLDACKDVPAMIILGSLEVYDKDDDIQPFVFQQRGDDDELENILAVAIEGNFPNYSKGNGHTDEYNLWEEFIFPTLMDKHEAAADMPSFFAKIRSSQFEQAVLNPASHRGCVVILPLVGDIIAYGRNELGGEFEWGNTTQTCDWGKPSVIEKTASAVAGGASKFKSRLAAVMGSSAPAHAPATPAAPEAPKLPNGHEQDPKTGTVTIKNGDNVSIVVPSKLQGNARNAWIRLMLGLSSNDPMPANHMSKSFAVSIPKQMQKFAMEDVSTRDNVRDLAARVKVFQETGAVAGPAMQEAHKQIDEQVQDPNKTGNGKDKEKPIPMDFLPELTAETKKGTVDFVTDWATRPDGKHPSALDIQKMESKWPTFSSMMGINPVDMTRWTIKDVKDLGKKFPDALGLAFIEMRRIAIDHGGFSIKEEPVRTPDKQVEVPSPQPEVAPAQPAGTTGKKSRLERLTGKAA